MGVADTYGVVHAIQCLRDVEIGVLREAGSKEIIYVIVNLRSCLAIQARQFTLRVVVHTLMKAILLGQCIIYITTIVFVIRQV